MTRRCLLGRWKCLLTLLTVAVLMLAGCGRPQPEAKPTATGAGGQDGSLIAEFGGTALIEAAKKEGTVIVYTANLQEQEQAFVDVFQKRFPEIKVVLERRGGGPLHQLVVAEAEAKKLRADVLEYSDIGLLQRVLHLLEPHTPPTDAKYPATMKEKGLFYPDTVYLYYIVYNSAVLPADQAPKSWRDLTAAHLKGKIGIVGAGLGGTSWASALFQRQVLGEDYWKQLAAQKPQIYTGGAALINAVVSGEVSAGIVHDVVAQEVIKKGAPVKIVYPPEGVVMLPFNMAVVKGAVHPNAARLWVNWKLSREGQEVWVKANTGFSAREDIASPAGAPQRAAMKLWTYKTDDFIKLRDAWVEEWNQLFGYRPK